MIPKIGTLVRRRGSPRGRIFFVVNVNRNSLYTNSGSNGGYSNVLYRALIREITEDGLDEPIWDFVIRYNEFETIQDEDLQAMCAMAII